ncbi:MAG: arginyltransferase [Spirochaetia bacterium]|jgi:arginine-tRNA-protein transferase|nr:arginyltransferase [Spirochaetia bacterium]
MVVIKEKERAKPVKCPYLPGRLFTQEFFLAYSIGEDEFSTLVAAGWRKFGFYFFRPACPDCRKCIPVRVIADKYIPTKNQRRILRKNSETDIQIISNTFSEERYQIYKKHSDIRFGQKTSRERYVQDFCISAAPSFIMEYRSGGVLFGTGYLDSASDGLSSVYFAFDPDYSYLTPGILSCMIEIDTARILGKKYYYPGYYVEGNSSMDYKIRFSPYELYNWETKSWHNPEHL